MSDNRTTELRISEPLRGFIRHQSNRAYIDGGQARWLTEIADEIDAKHEQAVAATMGEPGVLYMRGQTEIEVDGQRFERVKESELEHHDTGWVSCRECNTSWKNDRPHVYRRCPYCGAKVVSA